MRRRLQSSRLVRVVVRKVSLRAMCKEIRRGGRSLGFDDQRGLMKKQTVIQIAIIGVAGFIVAPFIVTAIGGIIGLAAAGIIGGLAIALAPWASMKLANIKVQAVRHEAASNPIPTLRNQWMERCDAVAAYGKQIDQFNAHIHTFSAQLAEFTRKYPQRAGTFSEQLKKMNNLKEARFAQYQKARADLAAFKDVIDEAEAIWNMTQAAAKLNQAAGMDLDPMEEIKSRTALESVQLQMGESFAQLERLMVESEDERVPLLIPAAKVAQ